MEVADRCDELLPIRQGDLPFKTPKRRALDLDGQFQAAFERTTLPEQPDYRRADGFYLCSKEDGDD